jgi:galactonate dehydratase
MDIGIDLHGRFSPAMAKLFIKEVEQYRPMFIEEPMLPGNDDVMADIARSTHIPIATGERLFTRWEFKRILELNAAAIWQPDVCHCGGILELKKIAAMGEVNFCGIAPHNPMGAIALSASFQCDASTINFFIQEHYTLGDGVLKTPFKLDADGFVPVPEGPGLGVEVDEEALEKLRIPDDASGMSTHLGLWRDRNDGAFGTW